VKLVRSAERESVPADFSSRVLKRVRKRRARLFGAQGARFFEHLHIPVEAAIPVLLAVAIAAIVLIFLATT